MQIFPPLPPPPPPPYVIIDTLLPPPPPPLQQQQQQEEEEESDGNTLTASREFKLPYKQSLVIIKKEQPGTCHAQTVIRTGHSEDA